MCVSPLYSIRWDVVLLLHCSVDGINIQFEGLYPLLLSILSIVSDKSL